MSSENALENALENVNKILDFKISDLCWIFVLEKDLENALENKFRKCVGK